MEISPKIKKDAYNLTKKLLAWTGDISGAATVICNRTGNILISKSVLDYRYETTPNYLADQGVITQLANTTIANPFYAYNPEYPALEVEFNSGKAREFLREIEKELKPKSDYPEYSEGAIKAASRMVKENPEMVEHSRRVEELRTKRITRNVIRELEEQTKEVDKTIVFSKELYDNVLAKLKLFGAEVQLPKDRNEDHLCRVLFQNERNFKKNWSCDELVEKSGEQIVSRDGSSENKSWRPTYNAVRKLNQRIYAETRVKDFLLTKPITTVKVNPVYLK